MLYLFYRESCKLWKSCNYFLSKIWRFLLVVTHAMIKKRNGILFLAVLNVLFSLSEIVKRLVNPSRKDGTLARVFQRLLSNVLRCIRFLSGIWNFLITFVTTSLCPFLLIQVKREGSLERQKRNEEQIIRYRKLYTSENYW